MQSGGLVLEAQEDIKHLLVSHFTSAYKKDRHRIPVWVDEDLKKAPEGILQKLYGIRRRFLWSGANGVGRKAHMVRWDLVCSRKHLGGAGVLNLSDFNKALLSKWRWWPLSSRRLLWCHLLEARFGCGDSSNRFPTVSARVSFTWRNILSFTEGFMDAIR
ncbi:hypothetical protein QJS10_CPA09g01288 [Acorus calamus]|uniref:Uncharacterized protein n=1 Tax=Acorus calamus TaxID=4465 RepID=A0AAV9E8F8_ACOCL|nr:hypothetical protein QJS10_CPA09g01288 [Acorus calamus]